MKTSKDLEDFINKHQTKIIIGSACIVTVGIGICAYKYRLSTMSIACNAEKITASNTIDPDLFYQTSKLIKSNLTGTTMTATELGRIKGVSAQKINKTLVNSGYINKLPSGRYELTELGKLLGKETNKISRYKYCFNNMEYDSSILNLL